MSRRVENSLEALKRLPEVAPSAHLEAATLDAMAAASRRNIAPFARAATWAAVTVVGALLAIWAMSLERQVDIATAQDQAPTDQRINELAVRSARLEQLLAMLPEQRRVMRADTASTIAGLEDRISWLDAALYQSEIETAPPEYQEALLRDRVEVMNALVNVRYAQSRAFIY